MKIALVLPTVSVSELRLEQRILGIKVRFGENCRIVVYSICDEASAYADLADVCIDANEVDAFADVDVVVHFSEEAIDLEGRPSLYQVSSIGRVLPSEIDEIGADEYPELDTHVFNRHGPKGWKDVDLYCFHYSPYGYQFRLIGLGPIDAFGHRIAVDLNDVKERPAGHKLVVCFGGSAVWGTSVLPMQSFPAQLQALLAREFPGMQVTVLNFGIPGAVVINSIQRFLLLTADLRPDVTILHDGVNDFYYTTTADQWLVERHAVVYQQNLELWAKRLHWRDDAPQNVNVGGPISQAKNVPPMVAVKAFARRRREFVKVAKCFGAHVITGLQPLATDKAALSPCERSRVAKWLGVPPQYGREFELVRGAMRIVEENAVGFGADVELFISRAFSSRNGDETHFADLVHADVLGEQVIAETYLPHVAQALES
ncbi:MAG: SGNH/GDSL hydrolase family protein [Roseitalea sp.]|nr:SGNH/GDSL hydrolase family protein [Roseitalea sp.]MBO6950909.1 SGNH/GDSL hydrolase family protein [Rhizobiaceae bacterium]MBO6591104.1 SGNH/GDSL hydrolase family protein [Roseitalea sp.]MBO6599638.1 SGNH/GDSL hydrolase family protein [Roseitalea sp.]MBO6613889.1 SGNH/GDSL hydrolase family protein [Roseitalea sp.]